MMRELRGINAVGEACVVFEIEVEDDGAALAAELHAQLADTKTIRHTTATIQQRYAARPSFMRNGRNGPRSAHMGQLEGIRMWGTGAVCRAREQYVGHGSSMWGTGAVCGAP